MSIIRRRYYIWLARAYLRRWYKTIITSIVIGVAAFFLLGVFFNFYILPVLQKKIQKVGYSGYYDAVSIPDEILQDVSYGLTKINIDGSISPGAAYKWEVKNEGKDYIFYIKKGQFFDNKDELTAETFNSGFKEISKKKIDDYTIELSLKEPYSPFLTSLSKPILVEGLSGLGEYSVKKIDVNGGFVKSINLQNKKNSGVRKIITFYPTQEALKSAYSLGEIDTAKGLLDTKIDNSDFSKWNNTKVEKITNYDKLLTAFYNNTDNNLSNKKLRQALNYALPASFSKGERAFSPIPPTSIYFSESPNYGISDVTIAKDLLTDNQDALKETYEISVFEENKALAEELKKAWSKIGIKTKIKVVNEFPKTFQILVYPINLPTDPDQYVLWHSGQVNNIGNYKNLRIDKLLEDGRSTSDTEARISIYSDFQKYLIDDVPASFLYFPYEYTVSRK